MDELKKKIVEPKGECPHASNPTQCLTQLFMSKELTDLTVTIPGHNEEFKVHRLVLGMWSRVFQAMLFGPMAEGQTITLEEDSPEAFTWLINYMYTGQTGISSIELALQVYLLANKYLMGHVKTVCSEYLQRKASAVSVPEILNIANLLEDDALIKKCTEELDKSPDSFWSSSTIGILNIDSMELLLKEDFRVSSESVIFQGVLNWGKAHLQSKEKEMTTITLRQEIERFIPKIRFLTMSLEEFVKYVLPDTIFTFEEVTALQLNIAGVPEVSLPPLFSTNKENRNRFVISQLNTCQILCGAELQQSSYHPINTANPVIFDQVKSASIIYLSKLRYEDDIGYRGTLKVKDSSGQVLQAVHFDGKVAEFKVPFKMLPNEKYTFTLGCGGSISVYRFYYQISGTNGLISGQIKDGFVQKCVFHYWK